MFNVKLVIYLLQRYYFFLKPPNFSVTFFIENEILTFGGLNRTKPNKKKMSPIWKHLFFALRRFPLLRLPLLG